jgi:hypothetical protein
MWRPMPRQFGAYVVEPGSRPGILINNGLPYAAQRQTAGHELGHHRLGHGIRLDVDLDAPIDRRAVWTHEEKTAEAFAAWFLMPRKAVLTALARLGLKLPETPQDAYQLSLLLGMPYASTVRHLPSLRLTSPNLARKWAAVPPGTIKGRLDPAAEARTSRKPDVWLISSVLAETELTVHPGDRLVISCPNGSDILDQPNWLTSLPLRTSPSRRSQGSYGIRGVPGRGLVVMEVQENAIGERARIGVTSPVYDEGRDGQWGLEIRVEGRLSGVARRWIS